MSAKLNVSKKLLDQSVTNSSWQRFCVLSHGKICVVNLSIGIYHLHGSLTVMSPFQSEESGVAATFEVENDRFGVYECQLIPFDTGNFVLLVFIFGHQNVYEFRVFDARRNLVTNAGAFMAQSQMRVLPNFLPSVCQNPTDNQYEVALMQHGSFVLMHLLNGRIRHVSLPTDFGHFHTGSELFLYVNNQLVCINRELTKAELYGNAEVEQTIRIQGSPEIPGDVRLFKMISNQLYSLISVRIGPNWLQLQLWGLDVSSWRWEKQFQTQIGASRRILDFAYCQTSEILTVLLSSDFERNSRLTVSCWWLTVPRLSDLCKLTLKAEVIK